MDWTADEIRQLRYRLGWSQAEMARRLELDFQKITAWESGRQLPEDRYRSALLRIFNEAQSISERVQRRPIAEAIMRDRGLSQIHDFDVLDSAIDGAFSAANEQGPKPRGRA